MDVYFFQNYFVREEPKRNQKPVQSDLPQVRPSNVVFVRGLIEWSVRSETKKFYTSVIFFLHQQRFSFQWNIISGRILCFYYTNNDDAYWVDQFGQYVFHELTYSMFDAM